jgi:glycerol uptake facilitator-like aquaporin
MNVLEYSVIDSIFDPNSIGAHINPAVTLGLAIAGETSWIKVPLFWFAQLFGGYLGAGLGYGLHKSGIT